MEKVTTKLISFLIEEAQKSGTSHTVEIEESDIPYFRMLLSRYNSKNSTKICVRRVHALNWQVCAQFDRFYDQTQWKIEFDLVQKIISNPDYKLSESDFMIVKDMLQSIQNICAQRLLENQESAANGKGRDVLK